MIYAIPTLDEFRSANGLTDSLTAIQMDRVWAQYDEMVWKRVQDLRTDPDLPVGVKSLNHYLAQWVIEDHLGAAWLEKHILQPHKSELARDYLNFEAHQLYKALSIHRVHELARRLYQMQSFDWFDRVRKSMRTRNLSGASFELDVLWSLQIASTNVCARKEVGVHGEDFDFSAWMEEEYVPVEAKAKEDRTSWSEKTIVNTVKGAARQLPKGRTGLLFIRIPTSWAVLDFDKEYRAALTEGVRQTSRVGAIISVLDKPYLLPGNSANVIRNFHYFRSSKCPRHIWDFCMRFREFRKAEFLLMAPRLPF
jgi:hypothetical protein